MKITVCWEVVLQSSLVDKLSHISTSSDQLFKVFSSIPEYMREHVAIFWDRQLSHFKFLLIMYKVLTNVPTQTAIPIFSA
jgi:hypothetical protein